MSRRRVALPALLFVSGCAVDAANVPPQPITAFSAPDHQIPGAYRVHIEGDDGLATETRPLAGVGTGVDVTADFRARFAETADAALSPMFSGDPASQTYDVTLTPVVDGVRIVVLSGGPINGETRVSLGVGAE